AKTLGAVGGYAAAEVLASTPRHTLGGSYWYAVEDAIEKALLDIGAPAIMPLVAVLSKGREVRLRAVRILEKLCWQPKNDTQRALLAIAQRRWDEVIGLGDIAIEPLISLGDESDVVEVLSSIGTKRAVEALICMMKNNKRYSLGLRKSVMEALKK